MQYLTIIGSFNLNPPAPWVYRLLNLYNLAVFDPVSEPASNTPVRRCFQSTDKMSVIGQ